MVYKTIPTNLDPKLSVALIERKSNQENPGLHNAIRMAQAKQYNAPHSDNYSSAEYAFSEVNQ